MKIDSKKLTDFLRKNYSLFIMLCMMGYLGYTLWIGYQYTRGIFTEPNSMAIPETNSALLFNEKQYESLRSVLEAEESEFPIPRNPFQVTSEKSNVPIPR